MAGKPDIKDCPSVLCVEGYSDLHFIAEMLESVGRPRVFIKEFNGRQDMALKLEAFLTPQLLADKVAIGVIVDADASAPGAFQRFQEVLKKLTGKVVPSSGDWTGTTPNIGLMVVPDAVTAGELETLVWRSWCADGSNHAQVACISAFETCLANSGVVPRSPDKARIGALLAFKNDEDPRLGPGARAKVFDLQRPELGNLRKFLEGLPPTP